MSWAAFIPRPAVLLGVVAALAMVNLIVLHYCGHCFLRGCSPDDSFQDNIGNVDTKSRLSYPRIDVVYTWVNGSDPRWRASKERYLLTRKSQRRLLYGDDYGLSFDDYLGSRWRHAPTDDDDDFYFRRYEDDEDRSEDDGDDEDDDVDENNVANSTVANATAANATSPIEASNQTNATAVVDETTVASEIEETVAEEEKSADDAASESRFRDSEELRYSLRSLEMFAPWIHKVYIVTDNQIPYWLNLDDPKVELVPHSAIFEDKSLLPVFSSPAIESQLHRVPGVSRRFVYFNDDVMLGAPTFPDDFYNLNGAQRVYLAWEVPKCNEGCHEHWLGDGTCDSACNVSSCGFDYPDCEGVTEDERKSGGRRGGRRKSSSSSSKTKQSRSSKKSSSSGGSSSPRTHKKKVNQPKKCATGCVHTWLGDGTCDKKCDVASCMYDLGDCGGTHTLGAVGPGTTVVEVPVGAFGVVVNVSDALLSHELDDGATLEAFVNDDSREVVTDAFVLLRSKLLIVFIDVTLCRRLSIVARTARRSAMKNSNLTTSVIPHYDVANWTATVTYATTGVSRDGVTNATYYNETEITYNFHLFDPAATSVENSTASMAEKKKRARDDWLKKYRPSTTNFDAASCGSAQQQSNEAVIVELGTRWSVEVRMSADSENFSVEDYDVIELISVVTHNKILPTKTLPPVSARLVAPLSR